MFTLNEYRLFGYWLGKGVVSSLKFSTIDEDIVSWASSFSGFRLGDVILPKKKSQKKVHNFSIEDKGLYEKFSKLSDNKRILPPAIHFISKEEKIEFLGGVLDAEGFVARDDKSGMPQPRYMVGFCIVDNWAKDVEKMLISIGTKMWVHTDVVKSGMAAHRYSTIIPNFLLSGVEFKTSRKQNRIEQFIQEKKFNVLPASLEYKNVVVDEGGKHRCPLCQCHILDFLTHAKRSHNLSRKEYNILFPNVAVDAKKWKGKGNRQDLNNIYYHSPIEANLSRIFNYLGIEHRYREDVLNVRKLGRYYIPFALVISELNVFLNFSSVNEKKKNRRFQQANNRAVRVNRKLYADIHRKYKDSVSLEYYDAHDLSDVFYENVTDNESALDEFKMLLGV